MQGYEGGLDGKDQKEEKCPRLEQSLVAGRDVRHFRGKVRHVECAGDPIDQPDRYQEQR